MTHRDKIEPTATDSPRRVRTRAIWWRWMGMATVALAVVLATPVALSFVPTVSISCPATTGYWERWNNDSVWRYLGNGTLRYSREQDGWIDGVPIMPPRGLGAFSFRWERSPGATHIDVPIWPAPILLGLVGASMRHRANNRIRRALNAEGRILPTDSRWRSMRRVTTVCTGLATASVIMLSFASARGVRSMYFYPDEDQDSILLGRSIAAGVEHGSAILEQEAYYSGKIDGGYEYRPRPGPLRVWWDVDEGYPTLFLPVWPVAVGLLGIACIMTWRRERAILRTLHGFCPTCAYPIDATQTQCPECGRRTAHPD